MIPAKGKAIVPTDISIAVPEGCYGRVAPRSGLATKHFIDTGAGVIDADYRGPVGVVLFNFSEADFAGQFSFPFLLLSSLLSLAFFLFFFFFLSVGFGVSSLCFIYSSLLPFTVKVGDRVAQLILEKIETPEVVEVADLDDTERGAGGFGSTGGFGNQ